ncbi:MAG TPA: MmgE/PrpD family protein, partial [Burkholderiales bacterium]|nr:MmgE/PrpD family protein [Burkholderiales bacterium]
REGKRAILNVAGCVLAGREDPAVELIRKTFPGEDALVDAAAATAHDYDDTHLRTVIHTGPPIAGTLFALTKHKRCSGVELLHAFILGVETTCRMGNAVTPGHYERGWHITSTCGVFGAAAAAGKILGLSERQFTSALGIAATQAAGLVEVLGSMARVLNAGFAARNGMQAALLAAEGFQGPERPIEGLRGFVNAFGGDNDLHQITHRLGEHWEMTQVAYKPYPCGVVLHALIDGCLELREKIRNAEKIVVTLHPLAIERTDRPEPRNAIEARLSAQHAVAVALLHGRAGLAEFSDAAAVAPALQAFRPRVSVIPDDRLDRMAAIITAGGDSVRIAEARPMDDARLEAKFRELAGARADEWMRFVDSLESLSRVSLPD